MHSNIAYVIGLLLAISTVLEATPRIKQRRDHYESGRGYAKDNVKDYTGAQVWETLTDISKDHDLILELEKKNLISTWEKTWKSVSMLVESNALSDVKHILNVRGIQYNVTIDDLQKRIHEENVPLDDYYQTVSKQEHPMTWKKYHRLSDIHKFLDYLAKKNPSLVRVQSIGKTLEERDLKLIRISDGKAGNKAVFIDGGIHAREWISPATVTYIINQLVDVFNNNKTDVLAQIDWHILPVLNPDGYEFTHTNDRFWRKNRRPNPDTPNCVGTDLNRNFDIKWGTGQEADAGPCSEIYPGSGAFSERESKALSEYIKNSDVKFSAYLTYHSYGQLVLYPWGYSNEALPDKQDLVDLGNKMAKDYIKNSDAKFSAYLTYHSFGQIILYPWGYSDEELPDKQDLHDLGLDMAKAIKKAGKGSITGGSSYRVGQSSSAMYLTTGSSDDWARYAGIKYSYTIELNDKNDFVLPPKYIEPVGNEAVAGLRAVAKRLI